MLARAESGGLMTHIEMAKAALEACDHAPVSLQSQMAQVAIAHALVAIADMMREMIIDLVRWQLDAKEGER